MNPNDMTPCTLGLPPPGKIPTAHKPQVKVAHGRWFHICIPQLSYA